MSDESKTEQPTGKRLSEAHEKGQFARAPDIQVVCVLVASYYVLSFAGREYYERIASISIGIFAHLGKYAIQPDSISEWTELAARTALGLSLPMAVTCGLAGALAGGLQSHFRLSPKALTLSFAKLNPMAGLQRLISPEGFVKVCSDTLKLVVVGIIVWMALKNILIDPIFYTPVSIHRLGEFMSDSAMMLMRRFIFALGIIAAANYAYQLRKTNNDMKMSLEEVKEEGKQSSGNPEIKMAMRRMARQLARGQMLKKIPTADVVITNPTHYAVALKYERGKDKAPMVLAKGEGAFAKRLKQVAAEHDVPMIENKSVARMLFKVGRVGKPIPAELYQAVADILAFVYKTHRYYFHRLKERRAME